MTTEVRQGEYGVDGNHEFKITDVADNGSEVQIEYLSDGERAWFQSNRFDREAPGFDWQLH
ncbi:hypothetical protein GCM10009549_58260 [Streptomyces thermoalcalitolerans]|uniref:Uncharacterized protein n=2 Tax=Actinomycetota TaxID=201174 RepID=A0ABP4ACK8_9ACTN